MIAENGRVPREGGAAATIAGLMASAAIFLSAIGVVYKPVRLIPVAMVVALIAVGIGGRHQRLASVAVAVAFVCWIAGMTIAIATEGDLF